MIFFKKSQASLEFILIFGISFSLILIFVGIFVGYFSSEKETLDSKHMENVCQEMMNNVENIYFLGEGNRMTMDTKFVEGIENFTIVHRNVSDPNGPGRLYFDTLKVDYFGEESSYFETNELYVRFNCTKCYHTAQVNGSWTSYYNESDFSATFKKIRFESFGDWVSIDFIKE
jgi:uncharacterized protein (UPF0333 family)